MTATRRVTAIITAAGSGTRLGADVPKAFVPLGRATLLERSITAMMTSQVIDHIVVTVPENMLDYSRTLLASMTLDDQHHTPTLVAGGAERADSVWKALQTIPDEQGVVIVHDCARALTPPGMIARVVGSVLHGHDAVIPVIPVTDTIKVVVERTVVDTPVRDRLRAVQTPQGFDLGLLRAANEAYFLGDPGQMVPTDDASLVEWFGARIHTVTGDPMAFKITTPLDYRLAREVTCEAEPTIVEVPSE